MYRRILVPIDDSACSTAALEHAVAVARAGDRETTVHVVHVVDTGPDAVGSVGLADLEAFDEAGADLLESAVGRVTSAGVAAVPEVLQGDPAEAILAYAEDHDVDLVVVGTHGRSGVRRFLLGSVAEGVVRAADVPVLTVREGTAEAATCPYERVLVATDGSAFARAALAEGVEVASQCGAAVDVLSVVDATHPGFEVRPDRTRDRLEATARESVDDAADAAREADVPSVETAVRTGVVFDEIVSYADERDADLVALGTRGRGGVGRALLGSVAERVVRRAPVPVLTVARPLADESEE